MIFRWLIGKLLGTSLSSDLVEIALYLIILYVCANTLGRQ